MKFRTFQFPIPNPECQIRDCLTDPVFCEEKEIKINANEETILLIHSRFIDRNFISITRKIRNDGVFLSHTQTTNLNSKDGDAIEDFKKQWDNGWNEEEAQKSEDVETNGLGSKEAQKWEEFQKIWKNECLASIHGHCEAALYSDILNEARVEEDKNGICQKLKRFFRLK